MSLGEDRVSSSLSYVLVTPAHDEAQFIEQTIKSVIGQTVKPRVWVIVDDGSTDGTPEIVQRYAADYPWILVVHFPRRSERNFAFKVHAFEAGYALVKSAPHDAVGCLDADISFDEGYFSFLLGKLEEDSRLGLVGTAFKDPVGFSYDYRFVSIEHVTGCCQLFRRECFEAIGGYAPVKIGAVDRVANIAARLHGWRTRTFTEKRYLHLRVMGSAGSGAFKAKFNDGIKDYSVGTHPLWELLRTVYQMTQRPIGVGGIALACGFFWAHLRRLERPVPSEVLRFCRREQMQRLKRFFTS